MNLHEYQAKELLRRYRIPVPSGRVVTNLQEVQAACIELGGKNWVIKAQIHAGGRGKAGGVVCVNDLDQAVIVARQLLNNYLVTAQTTTAGLPVNNLLIETPVVIARECYLGLLVDRSREQIVCMASADGGMEFEQVVAATPERILRTWIHPAVGLQPYQVRQICFGLNFTDKLYIILNELLEHLYQLFIDCDASLVEINPLVITEAGSLLAVDAKITLDDNALARQRDLSNLRDPTQENPREVAAREHEINYIQLDGNLGCMVNGAGLAMATMDLILLHGGAPANFLDVGGNTTSSRVAAAFQLILTDPKITAILVNIFGGIVRCDLIAEGIVQAVRAVQVTVPVIVRLVGNRAAEGLTILAASGLAITTADDLTDAAERAVRAAGQVVRHLIDK